MENSNSGCLMSWLSTYELTANQRNHGFEVSSSLTLHSNSEPFLDLVVTCVEIDFVWQPVKTSSSGWTEKKFQHFLKPNLHQEKKIMVTVCNSQLSESWLTSLHTESCSTVNDINRKLQGLQPALVNRKVPILLKPSPITCHTTSTWKLGWIGLWSFASFTHNTWPLANGLPPLKSTSTALLQGKMLTAADRRQKMLSKSSLSSETWISMP